MPLDNPKHFLKNRLSLIFEGEQGNSAIGYVDILGEPKKLNVNRGFCDAIADEVGQNLREVLAKLQEEDFSVQPFLTADDRASGFLYWDLEDDAPKTAALNHIAKHIEQPDDEGYSIENFSFDDMPLIKGFIFNYGQAEQSVLTYRRFFRINLLKSGTRLMGLIENGQLERLDKDILQIDCKIDLIMVLPEKDVFIIDAKFIEHEEAGKEKVRTKALASLGELDRLGIIDDVTQYENIADNIGYARRINNIASNPAILELTAEQVRNFVNSMPKIADKVSFTDEGKIQASNEKNRKMVIDLLNDDIFQSNLTKDTYRNRAKDKL